MYTLNGKTISDEKAQASADYYGITLQEWADKYGWESGEGKPNGPTEKTPTVGPQPTPAGDSSSGDISLESPSQNNAVNPFLLTLEELEGSEEEVVKKTRSKLAGIGIDIEEYIPGANAVKLTSRSGKITSKSWATKSKPEMLSELNDFIKENADLEYATEISKGKEGIIKKHKDAVSAVSIDTKAAEDNYVTEKIAEWNKRETLDFGMGQRSKITLKEEDFDTPGEYAEYKNWKETGVVALNEKLIEDHRRNMEAEAKVQAGEKVVRNLSDNDRKAVEATVSKQAAELQYRVENIEAEKAQIEKASKEFDKKVLAFQDHPTEMGLVALRREYDALNSQKEEFNNFVGSLDSDKTENLMAAVSDFGKNYSLLSKLGVSFKKTAVDMGYGITQGVSTLAYLRFGLGIDDAAEAGKATAMEAFEKTLKSVAAEQDEFSQGASFDNALNSIDDFASWAGNTAVQAIPSLSMAFTGAAAMPLFFVSGYGSKAAEQAMADYKAADGLERNNELLVQEDLDPELRKELEAENDEYAKTLNVPAWREMSASAVAGLAEVAFERLGTMSILKGANRAINPLKPQIHKAILKSANQEGLTEAATQIANNWADSAILGEDKNLFDGVMESYAGGALIGGPLELKGSFPAVYDNVAFSLMTNAEIKAYQQKIKQVGDLAGIENLGSLLDPNIPLPDNVSPEAAKLISELQQEGEALKDAAVERIGKDLTQEELMRIGELNIQMRRINDRFVKLAQGGTSAAELKAAEATLREKFDNLAAEREAILTDKAGTLEANIHNAGLKVSMNSKAGYAVMFARENAIKRTNSNIEFDRLDSATKNEYLAKAKEAGNLTDSKAIEDKAKEDFYIAKNKNQLAKDKQVAQEYLNSRGLKNKINSLDDAAFKEAAAANNTDINSDAFITPEGDIFVNENVAAQNGRVGVYSHEVLHAISKDVLNDAGANQAGKQLLEYLEQNSPETFAYVKARLDLLYENSPAYYEEAMNALSDYIAEGNSVDLNALGQVNRFLNKVLKKGGGKELSLENGEATFAFIAQYANKNKNSKTKNIIQNFVRATRRDDNRDRSVTKESKSLLQDINDLVPETVQTQADFFDRKVFNPIYNDGKLHPAIANYIRSRSVSKEEGDRIIESVADRLINFNPAATRKSGDAKITFGEFLFANVNFGKLDARKALFEESQERAQTESTDSEQARQIQAAETTSTQQAEAPTYKSLLERRVLAPEVVDAIRNKVKSTVRVMKTRMDKSVSKNVTVKPYIAEIKKTMGKQADIDLKKAMGGLKDGQFRKFLLKHKAAILQNMTTTYLMTAMPNAVQKSVNGQFTSDWKGKKIDREKVTTDSAGRTSGAELVRRLPNAATRLSDADFLANFFTEDGKLIRGRKESLAKAMAEEISFDIINNDLQDPNSEIRQAFENRQDLLGAELAENYIVQVKSDIDRGNVKHSKSDVALAQQAIDAKLLGDDIKYAELLSELPESFAKDLDDWVSDNIVGLGVSGFKKPLKALEIPKNLQDVVGVYFATNTNRNEGESIEQMLNLGESLLNRLPASLVKHLDAAIFGLHERYGNKSKNKKAAKLHNKFKQKQQESDDIDLEFTPSNIRIIQGGSGLMARIQNNILNKNFNSAKAKYEALQEEFGEEINNAEVANKAALNYILNTIFEIVTKDPSLMPGFLRMLEGQTNMGKGLRSLTGLSDIEIHAKSQGAYMRADGKQYYSKLTGAQKAKLEKGEITVNKNHPNYKAAEKFIKDFNANRKNPTSRTPADLLNNKGEHTNPSAKVFYSIAEKLIANVSQAIANPGQAKAWAHVFKMEAAEIVAPFDQQLNSKVLSEIQDRILGTTSEAGDLRLKALPKAMRGNLVETNTGQQTIGRAKRKTNEFLAEINAKEYAEATERLNSDEVVKESKSVDPEVLSEEFNKIIEKKKGVASYKEFSRIQAQLRGKRMGRFKFFIAPSADDFRGLVHYAFAGKGKEGEATMAFFEEKLMTPYFKGVAAIDAMRQQIKRDFKAITKQFKDEYKMLSQQIGDSGFNYDHALRVYLWTRQGVKVEGLAKRDKKLLLDAIEQNPELVGLADALLVVARRDAWPDPVEYWEGGSVLADLNSMTEKIGRKKFLTEFIENADAIFAEANLNKIEALYGRAHREAIEDSLYAMKNGTNRPSGANRQTNAWLNWINGSTGAIMFFNRRSALLQMLSFTNFVNWSDNNPVKAAGAFANQPQYWKDFAMIFNSDKLKERRGGLKQDVSDSEIADVAGRSKNSPKLYLLICLK